jgi:hypothetical protein
VHTLADRFATTHGHLVIRSLLSALVDCECQCHGRYPCVNVCLCVLPAAGLQLYGLVMPAKKPHHTYVTAAANEEVSAFVLHISAATPCAGQHSTHQGYPLGTSIILPVRYCQCHASASMPSFMGCPCLDNWWQRQLSYNNCQCIASRAHQIPMPDPALAQ